MEVFAAFSIAAQLRCDKHSSCLSPVPKLLQGQKVFLCSADLIVLSQFWHFSLSAAAVSHRVAAKIFP